MHERQIGIFPADAPEVAPHRPYNVFDLRLALFGKCEGEVVSVVRVFETASGTN